MGLIKTLFYKGEYLEVLHKTYENQQVTALGFFPYVIGSLSFLGRAQEAEAFFRAYRTVLNSNQRSYAYFFLALAWTRRSQFQQAKKYLLLNRSLSKKLKHRNAEIRYLMEQGISFFLFFLGKFEKSLQWNEKSMSSAIETHDFWMRALAQDLLANNLVKNGRIHEGLKHFSEALNYSRQLQNQALVNAIEISSVVISCEHGVNLKTSILKLKDFYLHRKELDSFSRANLGLELVRQYTLSGEWKSAIQCLNEISSKIFQSQNRRQEARFNLRWSEIHYLKNEPDICLHYVRSGRRCLEFVDHTYEMQFLSQEIKVLEAPELVQKLQALNLKFKIAHTDDEIHHLLQRAAQGPKVARSVILSTGYLSWLYRFFNLRRGQSYILLNLEPKSVTYLTVDGIFHRPGCLSTLNYKILSKLSEGQVSKEELVSSVWGYTYDPLRHDPLIYSTFSTLRRILSEDSRLIETSEVGYRLNAKVINLLETSEANEILAKPTDEISSLVETGLNSRQIQIMQFLDQQQFVSVKTVIKLFSTSEITANRDLRALFQKKLVLRVGQGRATHYTKAESI